MKNSKMTATFSLREAVAEIQFVTDSLTKTDLIVLKSYATPPGIVHKVLNAVLIALGYPSAQNWVIVRRELLSNIPATIRRLRRFRVDTMSPETLTRLGHYMGDKDFHLGQISRVYKGIALLVVWLRAVYNYGQGLHSRQGRQLFLRHS